MTETFLTAKQALDYLTRQGQADDEALNLIECALAFSLMDASDRDLTSYRAHLKAMRRSLDSAFDALAAEKNGDGAGIRAEALRNVMVSEYGYHGDHLTYNDFANINMFGVIDRRQGMPITLSILAIDLARSKGWSADGVNFPGHFLVRLEYEGERIIIDPFDDSRILEAKDLRLILKRTLGDKAELSADYYNACSNRDTLLRHQNNLKFRLIEQERYADAMDIVKRMALIAPDDHRLLLDKAVLFARQEQFRAAIDALTLYLDQVADPRDKAEAEAFLYELQNRLT